MHTPLFTLPGFIGSGVAMLKNFFAMIIDEYGSILH